MHDELPGPALNTVGQLYSNADNVVASDPNTSKIQNVSVSMAHSLPIINQIYPTTATNTAFNTNTDLQRMLSSYAELSNKVL